jgi:hypothetical protein
MAKPLETLRDEVLSRSHSEQEVILEALQGSLAPMPDWHRAVIGQRIEESDAGRLPLTPAVEAVERVRASLHRR